MTVASIRNKNPGAMWGRTGKRPSFNKIVATNNPVATKWGSTQTEYLQDGLDQGNNIAIFPTYLQGICADFDLWRTSAHYKNKPFSEAIFTWSGGNNTESYIKFVLSRVPGMTRNTIINDEFLSSPNGIKFIKAQAFHEAGTEYPASDSDFIEAQRRVFANDIPFTAAVVVAAPTAKFDGVLQKYQQHLIDFGYHEIGDADGLIGGKTIGMIKAFCVDRHIASASYPSEELTNEIDAAVQENWHRPIAPGRAYATEKQVATKVASVAPTKRAGLLATIGSWFTGGATVIGTAVKFLPDANEQVSPYTTIVQQYAPSVPTLAFGAIVVAFAIGIAWQTRKANAATTADYQTGKIN